MSKYHNRKTIFDGIEFDSQRESERYAELKMMEKGGVISNLQLQPEYVLQEGFTDRDGKKHRPITYIADFCYIEDGQIVVEDVKGMETEVFRIKEKLFRNRYPGIVFRKVK
jgi:hypothetical protein